MTMKEELETSNEDLGQYTWGRPYLRQNVCVLHGVAT